MVKKIILVVVAISSLFLPGCKNSSKANSEPERLILIKGINLEKKTVCVNEDVMVSVEAQNQGGLDSNLMYSIGGQPSNPAILKFQSPGTKKVSVVVKDFTNSIIQKEHFEIDVTECQTYEDAISFSTTPVGSSPGIYMFNIINGGTLPEGCAYEWDFGDGTTDSTSTPFGTHDYRTRSQSQCMSSYIVKVTAIDKRQNKYTARRSISLPNVHYISNQMGSPTIPVIHDRFPSISNDLYTLNVGMNNIYENEIEFDEAEMVYRPYGNDQQEMKMYFQPKEILDKNYLPAKKISKRIITFSRSSIQNFTGKISIVLSGVWLDDKKITAKIYIDIPPTSSSQIGSAAAVETDVQHVITDQVYLEKLEKARKILGAGKPITSFEIERLTKEGRI